MSVMKPSRPWLMPISGTRNGDDWPAPGETMELPDDEAQVLLDLGLADAGDSGSSADAGKGAKPAKG